MKDGSEIAKSVQAGIREISRKEGARSGIAVV